LAGLAKAGQEALVGEFMQRDFRLAHPDEKAENVFARLQDCSCRTIPVVQNGELVGVVTMENVGEFMMIQTALQGETPSYARYPVDLGTRRAA
jgi:predicted transcriptional regulator